jgi:steroid delta-isomerase-like uncharacterized protein
MRGLSRGGEVTTAEKNKQIVRRFVEEFQNGGNESAAEELLAADFVDRTPFPGVSPDRDGVKRLFIALRLAFPDLHAKIHDQLAEKDKVATRKTFRGTHRGEFLGISPSGRSVSFDVIDVVRIEDGRIAEHWNVLDLMGLLQQIGPQPRG